MKNIVSNTLFCLGALLVVFPWIIGIVDMAWYIMFGTQVSNIAWANSNRAFLAIIWPFMWMLALSVLVVA